MGNSRLTFNDLKLYIGIDVHKKDWSVSIFSDAAHHRTFCQPASAIALKTYLDHNFFCPGKLGVNDMKMVSLSTNSPLVHPSNLFRLLVVFTTVPTVGF